MSEFDKKTDELFKRQLEERASLNKRHEAIKASFVNDEPTGSVKAEIEQELERQSAKHAQEIKNHYAHILDIDTIEIQADLRDLEPGKEEPLKGDTDLDKKDIDLDK